MTAAQSTPGPWRLAQADGYGELVVCDDPAFAGRPVAIPCIPGLYDKGELTAEAFAISAANGRLIAAAPELLEACQAIAEYQRLVESGESAGLLDAYGNAFEGAIAAIAKATQGAQQ